MWWFVMPECGTCHPERLSEHDRQEVNDFRRYLALAGDPNGQLRPILAHPRAYAWLDYTYGRAPAPPEMWEGDDN